MRRPARVAGGALAACLALAARDASAALVPIHTSADSGFQVLRPYRGAVYGGTYGGQQSRVYRITKDDFVEEAVVAAESVSALAACPGDACLVANIERLDQGPTALVRTDATGAWSAPPGVGQDAEDAPSMGIGAGVAGGRAWIASLPYVQGLPVTGRLWSTTDGASWTKGPDLPGSMPMTFADFLGKAWTATTYGGDQSGLYTLEGGGWQLQKALPNDWTSDAVVFGDALYVATVGGVHRLGPDLSLTAVTSYGNWLAVARDAGGVAWLYTGAYASWRCTGTEAEVHRSRDGVTWELYQSLPECELQGLAVLQGPGGDELFAATRQEGGHGRVYYERFALPVPDAGAGGAASGGAGGTTTIGSGGASAGGAGGTTTIGSGGAGGSATASHASAAPSDGGALEGSCGCRTASGSAGGAVGALALLALAGWARRRGEARASRA